jgi:hypothetical protein|tara:strand:- start:781 stop:981 length:201 start_codon:yes stop_codon:yes gene_type:complete
LLTPANALGELGVHADAVEVVRRLAEIRTQYLANAAIEVPWSFNRGWVMYHQSRSTFQSKPISSNR